MEDCTYIVFEHSGLLFSKLIKESNPDAKVIHLCYKYIAKNSCADTIIDLDFKFNGCIVNSYARYEILTTLGRFNNEMSEALNNVKKVIIIDGVEDEIYSIMLHITKMAMERNIDCTNIFFEPFRFLGKRRLERYKKFLKEISNIKEKNYYFSCNDVKNKLNEINHLRPLFDLINKIQYNIATNLDKNIDLIIDKTIEAERPKIEEYEKLNPVMDKSEYEEESEEDAESEEYEKSPSREKSKIYKYVSVIYDDDIVATIIYEPSFYYKTDIEDIKLNDKVLVDRNGEKVIGTVIDVEYYTKDDAPFPLDKTKDIIKVIEVEPIHELKDIKYDNVLAVTIAESGAMGEPDAFEVVEKDFKYHHFNFRETRKSDLAKVFPLLKTLRCGFNEVYDLDEGWKWICLGAGNYLIIRKEYYDDYIKLVKEELGDNFEDYKLYRPWYEIIKKLKIKK